MKKAPLSSVKEGFESKEKLVAAVQKLASSELWLDRVSSAKGLGRVSNAKLLRLHGVLTDAQKRFGSRDKLISAIIELARRTKDKDYAKSLGEYPLPRLLDLHGSLEKRAKASAAKANKPAGEKKPAKKAAAAPAKAAAKSVKPASEKKPAAKKAAKKA
jgi:hypothetical protein